MTFVIEKKHPQGMVLLFTFCILLLLAILGMTIFLSSKDEAHMAIDAATGRNAFTKADLTAEIAVFLARASLDPAVGSPSSSLSPGGVSGRPEFVVGMNNFSETINLDLLDNQTNIKNRYILAVGGEIDLNGDGVMDVHIKPHVAVYHQHDSEGADKQLVGTASIAFGSPGPFAPGSLSEGETITFIVVTANGRVPVGGSGDDPSNFLTGTANAQHSIVTTIFREVPQTQ